jgi:CRP/FNR family transcriptional regulator, cyclic AMP receptor protein
MVRTGFSGAKTEPWPRGTLMSRLSADSAEELLSLGPGKTYEQDTVLLNQGAPGTHVYLIRSAERRQLACVKVVGRIETGGESLLGIRVSGDLIGELAFLGYGKRSATVIASTRLIAHMITSANFHAFLAKYPEAWKPIALMIADRLDWANRRRLDFAGADVGTRLARVIVELAQRHGYQTDEGYTLGLTLSQAELGQLIGAGPDATGLAVRRLRDAGLVRQKYRSLTIRDVKALRQVAQISSYEKDGY